MDPESICRSIVDRLRAQVELHLPPTDNHSYPPRPGVEIPLERLPVIGQIVGQLLDAELKLAALGAALSEHPGVSASS